jgi:mersacidin/lichenicidin family type 2 lantibiotic
MNTNTIIRAWKDEGYRQSLSSEQRSMLPANPAGAIELDDADLGEVGGGLTKDPIWCGVLTFSSICITVGCHTNVEPPFCR